MSEKLYDELDLEILKLLTIDSKKSARDIAKELNKAPTTISNRLKNLEKNKIIKKFGLHLDYEKLGWELTAIVEVIVSKGKIVEIENVIARLPPVLAVYDVTGTSDIILIAKFQNREFLSHFIKEVLSLEYVERTLTKMVLNIVKEDFSFQTQIEELLENKDEVLDSFDNELITEEN